MCFGTTLLIVLSVISENVSDKVIDPCRRPANISLRQRGDDSWLRTMEMLALTL